MPTAKSTEIRALVSLLGDEDPKIYAMVRDQVMRLGSDAKELLLEAIEAKEARLRLRARHLLSRIQLDETEEALAEMANQEDKDFDLEAGLVAIARLEQPNLTAAEIGGPLDEIAERIRPLLSGAKPGPEQIAIINRVLFQDLRFVGNPHELYEFDSLLLHRVLERRTGVPLSLVSVYLLITRRLGLPFRGIGLPSHFLAVWGSGTDEVFIDPYLGGKLLTRGDCVHYLTGAGFYYKDAYINEATSRELVIRTLRHLMVIYSKYQDRLRETRLVKFVDILQTRERAR